MFRYVDRRHVVIKEVEDLYNSTNVSVAYEFTLQSGEADELGAKIGELLLANGLDRYLFDDSRGWTESGASGAGQEIILIIETAVATGIVEALVVELIAWFAEKAGHNKQQDLAHVSQYLDKIKREIAKHFNPAGELEVLEIVQTEQVYKVLLKDNQDSRYVVQLDKSGNLVSMKKAPPRKKP